jgi:hypothetical protein
VRETAKKEKSNAEDAEFAEKKQRREIQEHRQECLCHKDSMAGEPGDKYEEYV